VGIHPISHPHRTSSTASTDYGTLFADSRDLMSVTVNNTDIVKYSQDQFGLKLPSELIPNRTAIFIAKLQASVLFRLCLKVLIVLKCLL